MKRVTGIGGIFFKAKDPVALRAWYQTHLGVNVEEWGGAVFSWSDDSGNPTGGMTVWSINADGAECFTDGAAPFTINYRVEDARGLAQVLRDEGCRVLDKIDESEYGIFAWVFDPEGNRVELRQPPAGQ